MAIRHNRRTARTELESFRSADVFKLTFKVSFLVLLRGAIAPPPCGFATAMQMHRVCSIAVQITTLGKLFAHTCLSPQQYNLAALAAASTTLAQIYVTVTEEGKISSSCRKL